MAITKAPFGGVITWDAMVEQLGTAIPVTKGVSPLSNMGKMTWARAAIGSYILTSADYEFGITTRILVSGGYYGGTPARIINAYAEGAALVTVWDAAGVAADLTGYFYVNIQHWT